MKHRLAHGFEIIQSSETLQDVSDATPRRGGKLCGQSRNIDWLEHVKVGKLDEQGRDIVYAATA